MTRNYDVYDESIKETLAIHQSMGAILTSWAHVEDILFVIFSKAVDPENVLALSVAFHSQVNFSNKLEMVKAAFPCTFDDEFIEKWDSLTSKLSKSSKIRNKIAHYICVTEVKDIKGEKREYVYLRPTFYNMASAVKDERAKQNMSQYSLKDLQDISNQLLYLGKEIMDFSSSLPNGKKPPPVRF